MSKLWRWSVAIACAAFPFVPATIVLLSWRVEFAAGAVQLHSAAGSSFLLAMSGALSLGLLFSAAAGWVHRRRLPGRNDQERLYALSKDLLCTAGLDGYMRRVSPGFLRATGYSEAELLKTHFFQFVHPDDLEALKKELVRIPRWKNSPVFQCRCLFKDGSYHWINWSGTAVLSEGLIYAVGRDTTEAKLHEEQLDFMSAIIASSGDAIMSTTLEGVITSWNAAAERMFGFRASEAIGQPVTVMGNSTTFAEQLDNVRRSARGAQIVNMETRRRRKDGRLLDVSLTISPVRAADGAIRGMSAIIRDISEKKRAEASLRATNQRLQEATAVANAANRAKSEFLANMSHEIRTPMNAILGFAERLEKGPRDSETRGAAATIKRNGVHLLQIINDLLDVSRIDAGALTIDPQPCSPRSIFEDATLLYERTARDKGVDFEVDVAVDVPEQVETDSMRLRQVLVNLIDNAVKFTEQGVVRVSMTVDDGHDGEPQLRCDVADSGIGIAAEHQALIFEPFMQADTSVTRRYGGTGLGLAISKRLCELLGGSLTCRSAPGAGSTFTLLLPLSSPRAQTAAVAGDSSAGEPAEVKPFSGCRIFLVDDCPDNRRLISILLREAGAEVALAENGRQAVDRALAREAAELLCGEETRSAPFDLILMDMQMPVMDGYQAVAELRRSAYGGRVIALTAHAMSDDRQKCLDAGCDDYLSKPIWRADLLSIVSKHWPASPQPPQSRNPVGYALA